MCRAYRLSESVELQKLSDTLSEIARAFLPLASSLSFRTADEYPLLAREPDSKRLPEGGGVLYRSNGASCSTAT